MAEWSLVPYLMVTDTVAAIAFYRKAFGATETARLTSPDGKRTVHAEIDIHGTRIYLADDFCAGDAFCQSSTQAAGRISLHLEVPDADAAQAQARDAGATITMPVAEMFWGARYGRLDDPFGISWSVSTQVRQPSEAEMKAAIADWFESTRQA